MSARREAEARRTVEAGVSRFVRETAAERLRLYRLDLQARITEVSPLAIDLASQAGFTLARVAELLPVPRGWPPGGGAFRRDFRKGRSGAPIEGAGLPRLRLADPQVTSRTGLRLGRTGCAVRGADDPAGDLGFVPERGVLEAVSRIGEVTLHTWQGRGFVVASAKFPESVLATAVGRNIEEVASHPALVGRNYRILTAELDEFVDGTVFVFRTGLVPLALPWADDLAREVAARWNHLAGHLSHAQGEMADRYLKPRPTRLGEPAADEGGGPDARGKSRAGARRSAR